MYNSYVNFDNTKDKWLMTGESEKHPSRGDWQKVALDHNVYYGAEWREDVLMFPPETMEALVHDPDAQEVLRAALRRSVNWRAGDVSEGDDSAIPQIIETAGAGEALKDPVVAQYIERRSREVKEADASFREQYPAIIEQIRHGIQQGVDQGYMPPEVVDRFESAVRQTAYQVVDLALARGVITADYGGSFDIIRIGHESPPHDLPLVVTHELMHKLSGGRYKTDPENGVVGRARIGFMEGDAAHVHHFGLNEVATHQLALGVTTGDFATLDPDKRADGDQSYYEIRKLATAFIEWSGGIIDLRTLLRASFEETGQAADRRRMITEIHQAYGRGALRKFELLCAAASNIQIQDAAYAEKVLALIRRIEPPKRQENGDMETGSIDTTLLPDGS